MDLWSFENHNSFNRPGTTRAPAYLEREADRRRWEWLRQCRMLYEGRHQHYFLWEGRTRWQYPQAKVQDVIITPYVTYNMLKLVANSTADLLFGAPPKLDAPGLAQRERLAELARRSLVHPRAHEASVQMSWAGGAFLEATIWRGDPYLEVVPPDEIFPQGVMMPDGQFDRYVRYATDSVGEEGEKRKLLLETTYQPGLITRRLRLLEKASGKPTGADLPLEQWPAFQGGVAGDLPQPEQRTGLNDVSTIIYIANKAGERLGISDFDGLIELQDLVNVKRLQVAIILAKHAAPKLRAPRDAGDGQGNFPAAAEVVFSDQPDAYGYITWDGQLEPALKDRDAAEDALCVAAERSPMLLGVRRGAAPESARKARLDATKDLAVAARKTLVVQPAFARALEIAQRLDQTTALMRSYPVEPVGVQLKDGLPVDRLDVAQEAQYWEATKSISLEDLVGMRVEDPDAQKVEVARVKAEQAAELAAATPSVLLGEGFGGAHGGAGVSPTDPNNPEAAGTAAPQAGAA